LPNRLTNFVPERALALNYLGRRTDAMAVLDSALQMGVDPKSGDVRRHARSFSQRAVTLRQRTTQSIAPYAAAPRRPTFTTPSTVSRRRMRCWVTRQGAGVSPPHGCRRMPCYPLFLADPHLRSLAGDPRFVRFIGETKRRWEELAKTLE
jgi:hypothetical protein